MLDRNRYLLLNWEQTFSAYVCECRWNGNVAVVVVVDVVGFFFIHTQSDGIGFLCACVGYMRIFSVSANIFFHSTPMSLFRYIYFVLPRPSLLIVMSVCWFSLFPLYSAHLFTNVNHRHHVWVCLYIKLNAIISLCLYGLTISCILTYMCSRINETYYMHCSGLSWMGAINFIDVKCSIWKTGTIERTNYTIRTHTCTQAPGKRDVE